MPAANFYVDADMVRLAAYGLTIPEGDAVNSSIARLILKAAQRIRSSVPSADARISRGDLDLEVVQGVVEDMVIRVLRNPGGLRQVSIDDYLRQIDTALSSGRLYLDDTERLLLTPPRRAKRARSIGLHIPRWRLPHV